MSIEEAYAPVKVLQVAAAIYERILYEPRI